MLKPNVTWGEVRKIHRKAKEQGISTPDDILANPAVAESSVGYSDSDYVYPEAAQAVQDVPTMYLHYVTSDDSGVQVLALIRVGPEEGTMEFRRTGEWVNIGPDDENPRVDDRSLDPVGADFVEFWDTEFEKKATKLMSDLHDWI